MQTTIQPHFTATAQRPDLGRTAPTSTATAPATGGSQTDEVTLSPEAQEILDNPQGETRPGQSAKSPAFLAQQSLAGGTAVASAEGTEGTVGATDYEGLPFGQVVKQFTPGHLRQAAAEAAAVAAAEAAEADETAVVPVEDGTDTPVVAVAASEEEPDSAPQVGTTTDAVLLEGLPEDTETAA